MGICSPLRDAREGALDRCYRCIPCLADPARRSALGLKVALVALHLVYAGILFLFDGDLIEKTKHEPCGDLSRYRPIIVMDSAFRALRATNGVNFLCRYTSLYLLLFVATLVQYFVTSGSSPGYVLDAMRDINETNVTFGKTSASSKPPASSKNGSLVITIDSGQSGRNSPGSNATYWTKRVLDAYPPGTSIRTVTCSDCNMEQPPRAKHCHDCDRCVLQFDHHCVWLGTCIGWGNHCKFWWYICEETALCLWTGILYITYLKTSVARAWLKDAIMILLLITLAICLIFLLLLLLFHSYLVLSNQTTYELVRRRRIPYLRGIPERVYPFSKGICRNLYNFCCVPSSTYSLESLPTALELEEKSRPYTCSDLLSCRCC